MPDSLIPIQVRSVPESLWLRVRAEAAMRRMTMGQVVAEALRLWLNGKDGGSEMADSKPTESLAEGVANVEREQ